MKLVKLNPHAITKQTCMLLSLLNWQDMDGDTDQIKQINAYLTWYIVQLSVVIPADECLTDARHIASLSTKSQIKSYLMEKFEYYEEPDYEEMAEFITAIIL